jgi:hypothetical protein
MTLGQRLQQALDLAGYRVLAFRDVMKKKLKNTGVTGYTHPAIKRYLDDEAEPSLAFLRVAAEVLGVRYPWLVVGQGAMTEEEEVERVTTATITATASAVSIPKGWKVSGGKPSREHLEKILGPVLPSVMKALKLPGSATTAPWVGGLNEIGRQLPDVEKKNDEDDLHPVANALHAAIDVFGLDVEEMPEDVLSAYIFGVIPGLLVLAREARDQREEA